MTKIVLLAVAAAWAAVLLPPLLRNRSENRPGTSVSDFNRQLSSLQRSVPTRGMAPMRSMARPLTQSPLPRPAAPGRPGQLHRAHPYGPLHSREQINTASLQRRSHREPAQSGSMGHQHRQSHLNRTVTTRHELRQRRSNVVFMLTLSTCATLFLAATTHANVMMYAFALSFLALCGYCYKLVQLKQNDQNNQYADNTWFRAA
jgi:hypothetical protein